MNTMICALISLLSVHAFASDGLDDFRKARIPDLAPSGYLRCERYTTTDGTEGVSIYRTANVNIIKKNSHYVEMSDESKIYQKVKLRTRMSGAGGYGQSCPDLEGSHECFVEINKICYEHDAFPPRQPAAVEAPAPAASSVFVPPRDLRGVEDDVPE